MKFALIKVVYLGVPKCNVSVVVVVVFVQLRCEFRGDIIEKGMINDFDWQFISLHRWRRVLCSLAHVNSGESCFREPPRNSREPKVTAAAAWLSATAVRRRTEVLFWVPRRKKKPMTKNWSSEYQESLSETSTDLHFNRVIRVSKFQADDSSDGFATSRAHLWFSSRGSLIMRYKNLHTIYSYSYVCDMHNDW